MRLAAVLVAAVLAASSAVATAFADSFYKTVGHVCTAGDELYLSDEEACVALGQPSTHLFVGDAERVGIASAVV